MSSQSSNGSSGAAAAAAAAAPMQKKAPSSAIAPVINMHFTIAPGANLYVSPGDNVIHGPTFINHENNNVALEVSPPPLPATAPKEIRITVEGLGARAVHLKAFHDCLERSGSDLGKCQVYMDMLNGYNKINSGSEAPNA